jgi:hypothetical protein
VRPFPGKAYRQFREAFRRGDHRVVLTGGEQLLSTVRAAPGQAAFVPSVMVMVGAALVLEERYGDGVVWLEQGLVRADEAPLDPHLGQELWFHELLVDTYLLLGRWREATPYLDWLAEPDRRIESRLAATRGQLALATLTGHFERAHWLVNTAADLARRVHSNLGEALVEADRVMLLTAQGRLGEAVLGADTVGPNLARPGVSSTQVWANSQATMMYTLLARHLAVAGDLMTAERYLIEGAPAAAATRRTYCSAQVLLARSVVWREEGELAAAEPPARDAVHAFDALGAGPAAAIARREQAELARRLGLVESARQLATRAQTDLRALF